MSNAMYAVLFGVGTGAWAYAQLMRRTNDSKNGTIGAIAVAIIAFFVFWTLFSMIS